MRIIFVFSVAAVFILVLMSPLLVKGQSPQTRQPLRGNPISLFDGHSLEGWEKQNGQAPDNWVVEEGTIYRASKGGDLYHKNWYRDFELSFHWKLNEKGNSGIKYRVKQYGKRNLGCEYQIMDEQDGLFTKTSSGSIYALYQPGKNKKLNPIGEWNQSKIVVCGRRIEHWLNGEKIVEANVGSPDWLSRVENSKFMPLANFAQNREGRIFLQDHGQPVWFREIVLVPLDCDKPALPSRGQ